ASMALPPCDGPALQARLWDEARIEAPTTESAGRSYIRVSVQAYNTPQDGDALLGALAILLPQVAL
ncbi:MAG: aminotransferase, partial [Actinomycetota bacterium]|nr:aminotransferase [Actinomycetota bacterium]